MSDKDQDKKAPAPKPAFVKKSLSKAQREHRTRQIVVTTTIVIAVAVVALVGFAVINELYILPNTVVLRVGDEEITAADYQDHIRFDFFIQTSGMPVEQLAFFGLDPNAYLPEPFSEQALIDMAEDIVARQKAEELGIVVTDEEVQEQVELDFLYDAGEPEPTATPFPTAEPTRRPTITPTFVFTLTPVPTATPDPAATPTVAPSPTSSEPLPTNTPLPSPTPVDEAGFNQTFGDLITQLSAGTGLSEERVRELWYEQTRDVIIRNRLLEAIEDDLVVATTEEKIHVAHILVASEPEAIVVQTRLAAGEEFEVIAAEVSIDSSNAPQGGDLGWATRGMFVSPFEETAWAMQPGEISDIVVTQFGFHIIKMYDRQEFPLLRSQINQARNSAFAGQLSAWREEVVPDLGDVWRRYVPESLP